MLTTLLAAIVFLVAVTVVGYLASHKPSPQQKFFFDLMQRNLPR